ncbi:(2Fe-2S)-binding protein [Nonomuraea jiangxiensis]|uniref:Carbon-monoxide dehydrogenase small subunit n=1 Tax=Nonomuraea jiangxiensis TaxID=633440 RepID=A0A1G8EPP0_9ACTN|nr:(2Fe-2S)-binding protein [Nonomuraea jiangxiensis]SDH71787.1 carbon-monoxide dehydrogenase small subunit [Nonomuraea jiangxiensis]
MNVELTVNGEAHSLDVEPRTSLADALRDELGLTGTTLGCEHGVCGSCTVLVGGTAVRSCLMLAVQAQGEEVRTVEGLADGDRPHPLQEAFAAEHALQCGFCTPGFLMLLAGALAADPELGGDERRLDALLASNLCRCTGYAGIRRAAQRVARSDRSADSKDMRAPHIQA